MTDKTLKNEHLLNTIGGIVNKEDVKDIEDFGRYLVVILKDGCIFHTYSGLEIRAKAYVTDLTGNVAKASLYSWLVNLVDMKHETEGKEKEIFPETDVTYADVLDSMCIITEANLCHPITAFIDMDEATKFTTGRIKYLTDMQKKLEEAVNTPVKEETEEDIEKNTKNAQIAILSSEEKTKEENKNE